MGFQKYSKIRLGRDFGGIRHFRAGFLFGMATKLWSASVFLALLTFFYSILFPLTSDCLAHIPSGLLGCYEPAFNNDGIQCRIIPNFL